MVGTDALKLYRLSDGRVQSREVRVRYCAVKLRQVVRWQRVVKRRYGKVLN